MSVHDVRRLARRGGQALAWVLLISTAAVVSIAVLVPRLGGATPYVVLTGSMRPEFPPGTLVVVRPVPVGQVRVGDVVTYQLESGKPEVVTHRVVAQGVDGRGRRSFQTKGDANRTADQKWVRPVQIRGVQWYHVPYLGYVTSLLTGDQRELLLKGVIAGLLGYALWMWGSAVHDRIRDRRRLPA